jgi:hypothetical protein
MGYSPVAMKWSIRLAAFLAKAGVPRLTHIAHPPMHAVPQLGIVSVPAKLRMNHHSIPNCLGSSKMRFLILSNNAIVSGFKGDFVFMG